MTSINSNNLFPLCTNTKGTTKSKVVWAHTPGLVVERLWGENPNKQTYLAYYNLA